MNCLSINTQGAGSVEKRVWIKSLCVKFKVIVLAIQETKKELIDLSLARSFWGNLVFLHFFSPSRGASVVFWLSGTQISLFIIKLLSPISMWRWREFELFLEWMCY